MKHTNSLGKSETVLSRSERPEDYHCTCSLCSNFLGEIYDTENDKYYSNRIRKGYYVDSPRDHLDVGHIIGYRYAIQNFCPEGGWVFDPTVGSGTAIVEDINNRRSAAGIELEFPHVAEKNIYAQFPLIGAWRGYTLIPGDALETDAMLAEYGFAKPQFDLIVNGTPYPTKGHRSSDSPERDGFGVHPKDYIHTFDYEDPKNIGKAKEGGQWENLVRTMYNQSIEYLKPGGYFIIIKDLMRNRKPYLLHKIIADIVLEDNLDLEPYGYFLHKHVPTTMFMNTYPKRFPDIKIPLYQTGIVLKKIG